MTDKEQLFAHYLTPEMNKRLTQAAKAVVKFVEEQTSNPEEVFIVLDGAKRILELKYAMFLVGPITHPGGTA